MVRESSFRPRPTDELNVALEADPLDSVSQLESEIIGQLESLSVISASLSSSPPSPSQSDADLADRREMSCCTVDMQVSVLCSTVLSILSVVRCWSDGAGIRTVKCRSDTRVHTSVSAYVCVVVCLIFHFTLTVSIRFGLPLS